MIALIVERALSEFGRWYLGRLIYDINAVSYHLA